MKKLSLILPLLGFAALSAIAFAGEEKYVAEKEVPKVVREAFHEAYPHAQDVKYESKTQDGKPVYEVEFNDQGKEREASYTPAGTLFETEEEIAVSDLPPAVAQAVTKAYPNAKVKEAEKVMRPDGTLSGYEVEIVPGKKDLELHLDPNGKILKTEAETEEDKSE